MITNSTTDRQICTEFAGMCRQIVSSIDPTLLKHASKLFLIRHTVSPLSHQLDEMSPRQAVKWIEGQLQTYHDAWTSSHDPIEGGWNRRSAAICRLFLRELHRYHRERLSPSVRPINPLADLEQRRARENRVIEISGICKEMLRRDLLDPEHLAHVVEILVKKSLSRYASRLETTETSVGGRALLLEYGGLAARIVLTVTSHPCGKEPA